MSQELLWEQSNDRVFLTIDRESRRNALSIDIIASLIEHLDKADHDASIRAVCITGAGDKAFCSGADLAAGMDDKSGDGPSGPRLYADLLKRMAAFGKPLLARVNGPCLAGGLGLMLSCDLVISRNDAVFFTPEVNVGVFPMMVGALLARNVGWKKAMEMVLTGRKIAAPEAESIGLITRAVDPAMLDREIDETLDSLASKSPAAIRIGKEAFRRMMDMPFEDAVDHLCGALGRVAATEDAREGMAAFLEKRKPLFKGR